MSVLHEEDPEQTAARLADEAVDRQLAERVREAERLADAARKKELNRIIAALDLIDAANGELLRQAREIRAVRGGPLYNNLRPPPGPSLGGLTPGQMEEVERRQRSAGAAWENEKLSRQRWIDDQADVIRSLTAGQSPENVARIKAEFRAQKGS